MFNLAFVKKEIKEIARTYRWWLVPLIFLFIGLSAPASAKFLPDILKGQLEAQDIKIQLPEPSAVEAYAQYSKNLIQIGALAVILLTMGLISEEKAKGVLAQVLTKPVKRSAVITSKFIVHGVFLILSLAIGAVGGYLYTLGLFKGADLVDFIQGNLALALYTLLIFTVTLLYSVLLPNQIMAGGLSLLTLFALSLSTAINRFFEEYTPAGLPGLADKFLKNSADFSLVLWPAVGALFLMAILTAAAAAIFKQQEL